MLKEVKRRTLGCEGILESCGNHAECILLRLLCSVFAIAIVLQPLAIQAERLTIERFVSLPSLIGTAPANPVWSPDSSRLAFLWNDNAMPFRDIWIVSAKNKKPKQITDMARDFPYPEKKVSDPDAAPVQKAEARTRGSVSALIWTPDGKALVFSYQGDLFRVNADGTHLKRLTQTKARKYALAFSPDGKFLSYLQQGDFWLWNQETDELIQATRIGQPPIGHVPGARHSRLDTLFASYKWSPDSRYIALYFEDRSKVRKVLFPNYLSDETSFNMLRRDYPGDNDFVRAIGIYSMEQRRLQMFDTEEKTDRRISYYNWSPDSSMLLVDQNSENAAHRWIYIVKPEDGSFREVWHDSRETRVSPQLWASEWQSDGRAILFVSDIDGFNHLYVLPLDNLKSKQLTKGNWSILHTRGYYGTPSLVVSSRTKEIYFLSTKKNPYERQVYKMPEGGGKITQVTSLPGCHLPIVSPDGSRIALLLSNDVTPTELYIIETKRKSSERRITHSPPKEFYAYKWIQPRYVTFKSHVDGVTLHGKLFEPPNLDRSKKYAVILGSVYSDTVRNRWPSMIQQYLSLEGQYIGMLVDIRGSQGYGNAFRDRFKQDVGGIDIEDLHSGVKYLKTLSYVDPERIGIRGGSYGGLLTVMSLFKKPGVYKAGVASAPATNVWHAMTSEVRLLGRPDTKPEVYRKGSAFSYGEDLQDHLMIVHGMQDSVVQFRDSAALAEKLMKLGKNFDFVVLPSATHGTTRKDYVATYVFRKLVGHFDRYLGRGPR